MTDSQMLLLVVALIYFSECASWANLHCLAFVSWTGGRWRWTRPGKWFGNRSGGLVLKPLFPPLGTSFLCQLWPLSISPRGIFSNVSHAFDLEWRPDHPSQFLKFDQIERVKVDEKKILVNGGYFCRTDSPRASQRIADLVRAARQLSESERETAILEALEDALNTAGIRDRMDQFFWRQAVLRILTNGLFSVVFIAAPIAVWQFDWIHVWLYLLAAILFFVLAIVLVFRSAYRELYPQDRYHRRMHMMIMVLNPLSAIRAHDVLSRDLLAAYHPLAAAQVLCSDDVFRDFARSLLLDLRHPIAPPCMNDEVEAQQIESWFRERNLETLEQFVQANGIDVEQLLGPDEPLDATCRSYCPRCRCQFVMDDGRCETCGGIPLIRWD